MPASPHDHSDFSLRPGLLAPLLPRDSSATRTRGLSFNWTHPSSSSPHLRPAKNHSSNTRSGTSARKKVVLGGAQTEARGCPTPRSGAEEPEVERTVVRVTSRSQHDNELDSFEADTSPAVFEGSSQAKRGPEVYRR